MGSLLSVGSSDTAVASAYLAGFVWGGCSVSWCCWFRCCVIGGFLSGVVRLGPYRGPRMNATSKTIRSQTRTVDGGVLVHPPPVRQSRCAPSTSLLCVLERDPWGKATHLNSRTTSRFVFFNKFDFCVHNTPLGTTCGEVRCGVANRATIGVHRMGVHSGNHFTQFGHPESSPSWTGRALVRR